MTLRPEGTAPVCRAYVERGMASLSQPVKLFYLAPIFRYERPQAGRFRQHHQFGFEAIGEAGAALDAEVIDMAWRFFETLGLKGLTLQINSIGCPQCRPAYLAALRSYYQGQAGVLCADCRVRLEKNTLRLLDCKQAACQALSAAAPRSIDCLCAPCGQHFEELKQHLALLNLPFNVNSNLVRGLDYYTRTVFEIQPLIEGGQSTIGGGGRYDGLIEQLGGRATPGVGFAAGIERIVLNLKKQEVKVPGLPEVQVYVAWAGVQGQAEAVKVLAALRQADLQAVTAYGPRSLKAQMRQAGALDCHWVVIIGEEELAQGMLTLKDMRTARQEAVSAAELAQKIKEIH